MTATEVAAKTVRGQYGAGKIERDEVPGYREESGVAPNSNTETYIAVEFRIENWRWAGVPFYLRTGKRLAQGVTELAVHFKRPPQPLFADNIELIEPNVIVLRIHPNEGIDINFDVKHPAATCRQLTCAWIFAISKRLTCAFLKPMKLYCWMRCAVMSPCSPVVTELKRNGD